MSSMRTQIIEAVKARLQTITKANGYNTDVAIVQEEYMPLDTTRSFPALLVIDAGEDKEYREPDTVQSALSVIVTGYLNDDSALTAQAQLRHLLNDVERALCEDHTLDGLALNVVPASVKTDNGLLERMAVFDFTFVITYYYDYGRP